MKKIFLFLAGILTTGTMFSQWTGTSPSPITTTQYVGSGTTTPASRLTVYDPANSIAGQQIRIGTGSTTDYTFGRNPTSGYLNFAGSQTGHIAYTFTGGPMGIGTVTPSSTLTVQTSTANDGIKVIQGGTSAAALSLVASGAGARNWGVLSTGSASSGGIGNFSVYDYGASLDRLYIQGSSGNVGLGTTAPDCKLHVNAGPIKITGANSLGGPMLLLGGTPTVAPLGEWGIEYNTATPGYEGVNFWRPYNASGPVVGNYFLFLANTGKVGINTNNPTAQFTVNGNVLIGDPATVSLPVGYKLYVQTGILAEKVKVALTTTTDWSDYVFEKNYQLKPIEDVNAFITSNKHLPGVPSADELKEQGGFDLGKMDAKLLEKIEELTIYVIQLNEKNKELTDRLSKLESSK